MNNLIAFSGKIGSGKDTTAYIWQYLIFKKRVESGELKELYHSLQSMPVWGSKLSNWEIKKFAFKVKQCASIMLGLPVEAFEEETVKNRILGPEWDNMTIRTFLQIFATEACRNNVHSNIWVNSLFTDYKKEGYCDTCDSAFTDNPLSLCEHLQYPKWLITDLRFPNEVQTVKKHNGLIIRIERHTTVSQWIEICDLTVHHSYSKDFFERIKDTMDKNSFIDYIKDFNIENKEVFLKKNLHESETLLDNYEFDYVIKNAGTLEALVEEVKQIQDIICLK